MYHDFCGVRFHEERTGYDSSEDSGEFQQEVTINDDEHETIDVPKIGDTRHATVMHDFNQARLD
jgi:hypothetical protein